MKVFEVTLYTEYRSVLYVQAETEEEAEWDARELALNDNGMHVLNQDYETTLESADPVTLESTVYDSLGVWVGGESGKWGTWAEAFEAVPSSETPSGGDE